MDSLGRKLAEGLLDDVTLLEFETNTEEGQIFQRRNVILGEGGQNGWGGDKGVVHLVSKSIYRPRGRSWNIIVGCTRQSGSSAEPHYGLDWRKFNFTRVEVEQKCLKAAYTLST